MKKNLRKGLWLLFLAVFLVSTGLWLSQQRKNTDADQTYEDALKLALSSEDGSIAPISGTQPSQPEPGKPVWIPAPVEDDPQMEEMAKIDLAALRQVNPDVVGWIRIPNTRVDYPLMQGQDNDFYLKNTWDYRANSVGSIFLEYRNSADLTDYNTIVYGHNMNDGSMFATLPRYTDGYYWKSHPYIYILSDQGVYRYEVFASYKAKVDSPTYGLSFQQSETKANFLYHAIKESRYDTDIMPEANDRILTLSTCSGMNFDNRWVVQARLKMVELQPE